MYFAIFARGAATYNDFFLLCIFFISSASKTNKAEYLSEYFPLIVYVLANSLPKMLKKQFQIHSSTSTESVEALRACPIQYWASNISHLEATVTVSALPLTKTYIIDWSFHPESGNQPSCSHINLHGTDTNLVCGSELGVAFCQQCDSCVHLVV